MADVTRKIPEESIMQLDELQLNWRRRGINTTQKALIKESIALATEQPQELMERIQKKKKDNTAELFGKILKNKGKYDFGKNWLEEIDDLV